MHEELLNYFQKQHHHLEHYLALCFEAPNAEVVHQLRVSIKRIHAILLFTKQLSENRNFDAAAHYKPLRKLFRMAGSIRDVQVQQQLIAECASTLNTPFDLYMAHLKDLEKNSISQFFVDIESGKTPHHLASIHHIIKNTISSFVKEEIKTRAFELLVNQCNALRAKLAAEPDNEQLHQMRTMLKQMHYIMAVIRKSDPQAAAFPISLASIASVEVLLGNWHDRIIGLELLSDFRKKMRKAHEPETENYNRLATLLSVDQRIFRAQARRNLLKSFSVYTT